MAPSSPTVWALQMRASLWINPPDLSLTPSKIFERRTTDSVYRRTSLCWWQWGLCWLWHDRKRNQKQTNVGVVFFCLAREQWHTICLYPYCWQEQPLAPVWWPPLFSPAHSFPSPLFLLRCLSIYVITTVSSYYMGKMRVAVICLTHPLVCVHRLIYSLSLLYAEDVTNIARGEGIYLCDEMLNMVCAIVFCQQQLIQTQHPNRTNYIVILPPNTHTHIRPLLFPPPLPTLPPLIITVHYCWA